MNDLIEILKIFGPATVAAIFSYLGATKKANSEIYAVKEATARELESIKADTDREIKKIKADTEREIEKINAEAESKIKILEAESKSKNNDKLNDMLLEMIGPLFFEPKKFQKIAKLGNNPSAEDIIKILGEDN